MGELSAWQMLAVLFAGLWAYSLSYRIWVVDAEIKRLKRTIHYLSQGTFFTDEVKEARS